MVVPRNSPVTMDEPSGSVLMALPLSTSPPPACVAQGTCTAASAVLAPSPRVTAAVMTIRAQRRMCMAVRIHTGAYPQRVLHLLLT